MEMYTLCVYKNNKKHKKMKNNHKLNQITGKCCKCSKKAVSIYHFKKYCSYHATRLKWELRTKRAEDKRNGK